MSAKLPQVSYKHKYYGWALTQISQFDFNSQACDLFNLDRLIGVYQVQYMTNFLQCCKLYREPPLVHHYNIKG